MREILVDSIVEPVAEAVVNSNKFLPPDVKKALGRAWAVSYTHLTLPTNREV